MGEPRADHAGVRLGLADQLAEVVVVEFDLVDDVAAAGRIVARHGLEHTPDLVGPLDPQDGLVHLRTGGHRDRVGHQPPERIIGVRVDRLVLVRHLDPLTLTIILVLHPVVNPVRTAAGGSARIVRIRVNHRPQQVGPGNLRILQRRAVVIRGYLVAGGGVDGREGFHQAVGVVSRFDGEVFVVAGLAVQVVLDGLDDPARVVVLGAVDCSLRIGHFLDLAVAVIRGRGHQDRVAAGRHGHLRGAVQGTGAVVGRGLGPSDPVVPRARGAEPGVGLCAASPNSPVVASAVGSRRFATVLISPPASS